MLYNNYNILKLMTTVLCNLLYASPFYILSRALRIKLNFVECSVENKKNYVDIL